MIIKSEIPYHWRKIEIDDLPQVTLIHRKAFPKAALTQLGVESIKRYYEWQLTGPHNCFPIGVFDKSQMLLGFCFAGVFKGTLSGFINKNKYYLVMQLISHPWLLMNPVIKDRIKIALHTLKKKPIKINPNKIVVIEKSFGILSIAVDPEKKGLGIGKFLMKVVENEALKNGYNHMHLTVEPQNIEAVHFYEHCGWEMILGEQGIWNGRMEKAFTPK